MLSLATRMWEEIKHDEKNFRNKDRKNPETRTDNLTTPLISSKHASKTDSKNRNRLQTKQEPQKVLKNLLLAIMIKESEFALLVVAPSTLLITTRRVIRETLRRRN